MLDSKEVLVNAGLEKTFKMAFISSLAGATYLRLCGLRNTKIVHTHYERVTQYKIVWNTHE